MKIGSIQDLCTFAAGVFDGATCNGMSENDAMVLAEDMCKDAASRYDRWRDDDEDDDEGTFWERNRHWLLPTLVGLGAYWAGNDVGKNRPGMGMFEGAASIWGHRLKTLLGVSDKKYDMSWINKYEKGKPEGKSEGVA